MTAALWTGARAWVLGARLYLPEAWLTPAQRQRARIPGTLAFQEKWRLALTLLRQARTSGLTVTAVLGDAEFGDNATLRRTLHRAKLPYALGVSSTLSIFLGTPRLIDPAPLVGKGRPRVRPRLAPGVTPHVIRALAADQPAKAWRVISWRNGTQPPWRARFWARRVTPAHDWRERRVAPEVWLLCERDLGTTPRTKYYLVDLPATAALSALVRLAHQRWAIEQQYQRTQRRTRPRSLRGALAARLAAARGPDSACVCVAASRTATPGPEAPDVADRAGDHDRDSYGPLLRYASALSRHDAEAQRRYATDLTK